jgi:sec-independent protein translocase protein TatC
MPNFRDKFRYAIIIFVIFGAIITPDISGITMWLVTGHMILLYTIGIILIERREQSELATTTFDNS